MEGNKLEISGRVAEDPPAATYKAIPESDSEETGVKDSNMDSKEKNNTHVESDGAHEKMLTNEQTEYPEDAKINIADVKFISNDKQNGEVKLEIADMKSAFVGMGKEELMKYANDPFWVRLRWILFIAFWLLWLVMLIVAILIIVAAPKCAPPAPRTWWERGPLTEVTVDTESEILDRIKTNKIQGVIVSSVLDSYKAVNDSEIMNFLKIAKEKDINVIVSLKPATTNLWFNQSENRHEHFDDYYIWAESKGRDNIGKPLPPNNWLSPFTSEKSAWKYSNKRKQFYYSPEDDPHLNFRNPLVIDEFGSVIQQWMEAGASGIQLAGIPLMLVDESFRDENRGSEPGFVHTEYGFYSHSRTINVEGIGTVLQQWRVIVKNHTDGMGPFMLADDLVSLDSYYVNDTLTIDLPRHSRLFSVKEKQSTAEKIHNSLNSALTVLGNDTWPLWKINYETSSLSSDVLNILAMLLPGTTLVDNDAEINSQLLHIRDGASVMFGSIHRELLANKTVFAYLRVQTGNPGYLVACNPSEERVSVDFTQMKNVSTEITVQVLSQNYSVPDIEPNLKVPANAFIMPPKSAVVLTYVPKS